MKQATTTVLLANRKQAPKFQLLNKSTAIVTPQQRPYVTEAQRGSSENDQTLYYSMHNIYNQGRGEGFNPSRATSPTRNKNNSPSLSSEGLQRTGSSGQRELSMNDDLVHLNLNGAHPLKQPSSAAVNSPDMVKMKPRIVKPARTSNIVN